MQPTGTHVAPLDPSTGASERRWSGFIRRCPKLPLLSAALAMATVLAGGVAMAAPPAPPQESETMPAEPPAREKRWREELDLVMAMADTRPKALLLLDLVETCLAALCGMAPDALLDQAARIVERQEVGDARISDRIRIARLLSQLEQPQRAQQALAMAQRETRLHYAANTKAARTRRAQLLLQISLAYDAIEAPAAADSLPAEELLVESRSLLRDPIGPEPFPFQERRTHLELGLGAGGNSFTDTTVRADFSVDLYKQWPRQDVYLDGLFALDYDSSRSVVNGRPIGIATFIYRHHLSPKWNLFYDHLLAVNSSGFAVGDDDEDLTALTASYAGAGLNLWRGEHPGSFLDLQLGLGPRYEYDYVDFEPRKDKFGVGLGLILVGREIPIGGSKLAILFGAGSYLDDWSDGFALLDTTLDVPLSRRWSWSNSFVLRYRSNTVVEQNPNLNVLFSSGFTFTFTP